MTRSFSTEGEVGKIFCGPGSRSASAWESIGWASYAWAPSERAMKGRNDQSFSVAGSVPSPTPNQLSISGPLANVSLWYDFLHHGQGLPRVVKSNNANDGREAGNGRHCIASGFYTFARRQTRRHGLSRISAAVTTSKSRGQASHSSAKAQPWQAGL